MVQQCTLPTRQQLSQNSSTPTSVEHYAQCSETQRFWYMPAGCVLARLRIPVARRVLPVSASRRTVAAPRPFESSSSDIISDLSFSCKFAKFIGNSSAYAFIQ